MMKQNFPFYNIILRCDEYHLHQINLPDGYLIVPYQVGFETDWARLECEVGDFSNTEEAIHYFTEKYLGKESNNDILLLQNDKNNIIYLCLYQMINKFSDIFLLTYVCIYFIIKATT